MPYEEDTDYSCAFQERLSFPIPLETRAVADLLGTTQEAVLKLLDRGVLLGWRPGPGRSPIYDTDSVAREMNRRRRETESVTKRGRRPSSIAARLVAGAEPNADSGCWEWQRTRDAGGYGRLTWNKQSIAAHRAAYMVFVGEIPPGHVVDHLCCNPACINPDHLEAVTPSQNAKRYWNKQRQGLPNQFHLKGITSL